MDYRGSAAVTVEARAPTRLALAEESLAFTALGDTARPGVVVLDQAGEELAGAEVEWSSSAPDVATVTGEGFVTAVANGAAELLVSSGSVSDVIPVTVQQVAASIIIGPDSLHLLTGQAGWHHGPCRGRERARSNGRGQRRADFLVGIHERGRGDDLGGWRGPRSR